MKSNSLKHLKLPLFLLIAAITFASCKKDQLPDEVKPDMPQITNVQPKDPKPSDMVTITGTGFGTTVGDVKVMAGGTEVTISSVSSSEIKFAIPETLTSGDLSVAINGITAVNKDPQGTTITVTPVENVVPTFDIGTM